MIGVPPWVIAALVALAFLAPGVRVIAGIVLENQQADRMRTVVLARRVHPLGERLRARRAAGRRIAHQLGQPDPYPPLRPVANCARTEPGAGLVIRARIAGVPTPDDQPRETGAVHAPVSRPRHLAA